MKGKIEKTYQAVTAFPREPTKNSWTVENRLVKGEPWFRMKSTPGQPNAISKITLIKHKENKAFFQLQPITGKKHQLRLHLSGLGFPILNDRYYPELLPERKKEFSAPLQLLARKLKFRDPISGAQMAYESNRRLFL